ncbi:hypothetical protein DES35_1011025 [Schleiferia thermophila]|uniref:Uncharacterized protein n=1 Tax=Schleiferia thermophila TaxID=884107 RepID=A0A369ABR0_9FLAO|nr:hypothetical protein DES35_1011025 [Schleiferia thermophila]
MFSVKVIFSAFFEFNFFFNFLVEITTYTFVRGKHFF